MFQLLPTITKDWILERVTQEEIFEKYLGIPVQTKKLVTSPLRKDIRVTCGFKYLKDGGLIFKDFSGHFTGNCFSVVKHIYNVDFYEALEIIANDFNLINKPKKYTPQLQKSSKKKIQERVLIQIRRRKLNNLDLKYWQQFNISADILNKFSVFPLKYYWVNERLSYTYSQNNPAYAYFFGNGEFKIYHPLRKEFRFISNTQAIQGYNQLPEKGELLIITKSLKDVMTLYSFGINSIAFQNEIILPKEDVINELKQRFKTIYTFYDYDLTGVRGANKIRKTYNIESIFLTRKYKAKDISDYCKIYGINKTKKLIDYGKNRCIF